MFAQHVAEWLMRLFLRCAFFKSILRCQKQTFPLCPGWTEKSRGSEKNLKPQPYMSLTLFTALIGAILHYRLLLKTFCICRHMQLQNQDTVQLIIVWFKSRSFHKSPRDWWTASVRVLIEQPLIWMTFFTDGNCVFSLVPLIIFNPVLMLLQGSGKLCALTQEVYFSSLN